MKRQYYKIVDEYAARRVNKIIPNSKPEHARYIIKKLFLLAENNVRIYTGQFIPAIIKNGRKVPIYAWEEIIYAAALFLQNKKTHLEILLEKKPNYDLKDHPFFKRMVEMDLIDKIKVYLCRQENQKPHKRPHFMTADNSAYRLELDDEQTRAVANFNDAKLTKILNNVFQSMLKKAEPQAVIM